MYILFLGLRYLRRRISALAALLAVTFGVATLFTVLSVMEGYKVKLRELVRGLESHLTLLSIPALSLVNSDQIEEVIQKVPHVRATSPFIETIVMYKSLNGFSYFRLQGIEPEKEGRVGDLRKHLIRPREIERILPEDEAVRPGRAAIDQRVQEVLGGDRQPLSEEEVADLFSLEWRRKVQEAHRPPGLAGREETAPGEEPKPPPAALVVGINLLLDREVFIGDELTLITLSPDGGDPLLEPFLVVGGFKSGEFETDSRTALARLARVQNFLHLFAPPQDFRVEGIRIALDDYHHSGKVRTDILGALAQASAGKKVKELAGIFKEVASGITEERITAVAEDLLRRIPGGNAIPIEQITDAVREAAAVIAAPAVEEKVEQALAEAFARAHSAILASGGDGAIDIDLHERDVVCELDLLREVAMPGVKVWEQALGPVGKRAARPTPAETIQAAAGAELINAALRDLDAAVYRLATPHPLWAQVKTWEEQRRIFIQAVEAETVILFGLVLLVDAFIGFVVLLMLVLLVIEKTRDIGILLALGAKPRGVVWIFLVEGLVVVAVGALLGILGGYFFILNINLLHDSIFALTGLRLFDPEIYQMDRIPTSVTASEVVLSLFPSVMFGFLASLIPAIWASHQDPIKAIHYE